MRSPGGHRAAQWSYSCGRPAGVATGKGCDARERSRGRDDEGRSDPDSGAVTIKYNLHLKQYRPCPEDQEPGKESEFAKTTIMLVLFTVLALLRLLLWVDAAPADNVHSRQALRCAVSSFTGVVSLPGVTVRLQHQHHRLLQPLNMHNSCAGPGRPKDLGRLLR